MYLGILWKSLSNYNQPDTKDKPSGGSCYNSVPRAQKTLGIPLKRYCYKVLVFANFSYCKAREIFFFWEHKNAEGKVIKNSDSALKLLKINTFFNAFLWLRSPTIKFCHWFNFCFCFIFKFDSWFELIPAALYYNHKKNYNRYVYKCNLIFLYYISDEGDLTCINSNGDWGDGL